MFAQDLKPPDYFYFTSLTLRSAWASTLGGITFDIGDMNLLLGSSESETDILWRLFPLEGVMPDQMTFVLLINQEATVGSHYLPALWFRLTHLTASQVSNLATSQSSRFVPENK